MKRIFIAAAVFILVPTFAAGQIDQGIDGLGLYADPDAMINYESVEAGGILELYLMATNLSSPTGISAFELSLVCEEPHVFIGEVQISQPGMDFSDNPRDIIIAYYDPLPYAPIMHLATIIIYVTEPLPADLFLREAEYIEGGTLHNDLPVYVVGGILDSMKNLFPSSGSIDEPVFRINGTGPVAITNATLDGVKAIFR